MGDGVDLGTKEFRIKEFEMLRKEIEERIKDQWNIERDIVVATFGIFWALATIKDLATFLNPIFWVIWCLPLAILIIGGARWWEDHRLIAAIGGYIGEREKIIDPPAGGWENYSIDKRRRLSTFFGHVASWIGLLIIDIVVPVYVKLHS